MKIMSIIGWTRTKDQKKALAEKRQKRRDKKTLGKYRREEQRAKERQARRKTAALKARNF